VPWQGDGSGVAVARRITDKETCEEVAEERALSVLDCLLGN
jgi:hypothetical protein